MTSKPHVLILYLVATLIASSILGAILNWIRSLVTVALIAFIILAITQFNQKDATSWIKFSEPIFRLDAQNKTSKLT